MPSVLFYLFVALCAFLSAVYGFYRGYTAACREHEVPELARTRQQLERLWRKRG